MSKTYPLLLLLLIGATSMFGQQAKFGHINTSEIMALMPELKQVETELEAEYKQKENQLTIMQEDLRSQQEAYMANSQSMDAQAKAEKEQSLAEMGQKVQNYYQLAQQQIQTKEQGLKAPIIQKLRAAIQEVGDEQGFLYIFEVSAGVALYHSAASVDAAPLVKAKLGIQ